MINFFENLFFASEEKKKNQEKNNSPKQIYWNTFLENYSKAGNSGNAQEKYKDVTKFLFKTFIRDHDLEKFNLGAYDPVQEAAEKLTNPQKKIQIGEVLLTDLPTNRINGVNSVFRGHIDAKKMRNTKFLPFSTLIFLNVLHNEIKYITKSGNTDEEEYLSTKSKESLTKLNKWVAREITMNTDALNAKIKHNTLKWSINHKKKK